MRYLFVLLAGAVGLLAQPNQQVTVQPDCQIPFVFTAPNVVAPANFQGSGIAALNNKQIGCNVWQVQYASSGFGAVTLVLQSANDNAGVPGAFGTIGGTVVQGVEPQTSTTGSSNLITTFGNAFPSWLRMTATTATGSGQITGIALGWRQLSNAGSAAAANVNATIVAPLGQTTSAASVSVVSANDSVSGCTKTFVNLSGSGNTQLIAGVAAQSIYLCDFLFSTGTPEDFKLTEGTGVNCASGTADASALFKNISAVTMGNDYAAEKVTATAADALCANQANAQAAGVTIWFIQR